MTGHALRRASAGFTLVEMLVSMVIFALLGAASVAVLSRTLDTRAVVQAQTRRMAQFEHARALLKADLSQAAVRRIRHADGHPARDAFIATPVGEIGPMLAFVRRGWRNADQSPRASLQYVEYRVVDGRLERASARALDGTSAFEVQPLMEGIRSTQLRYFHRDQWSDGWPGGVGVLPEVVELEMEITGIGMVTQRFLLPGEST